MTRDVHTRIEDTSMRIIGFFIGSMVLMCFSLAAFGSGWALPGIIYAAIASLSGIAFIIECWRRSNLTRALFDHERADSIGLRAVRAVLAEGGDVPVEIAEAA